MSEMALELSPLSIFDFIVRRAVVVDDDDVVVVVTAADIIFGVLFDCIDSLLIDLLGGDLFFGFVVSIGAVGITTFGTFNSNVILLFNVSFNFINSFSRSKNESILDSIGTGLSKSLFAIDFFAALIALEREFKWMQK